MANAKYNIAKGEFAKGNINWETDTIEVMLVDNTYTFNPDHAYVSDITGEISGTGYSRKALTNKTVTVDNTNDKAILDCDDITFTGINAGTVNAMIVYKKVTNDTDSILIGYWDSGNFPFTTNGGDVVLVIDANGLMTEL